MEAAVIRVEFNGGHFAVGAGDDSGLYLSVLELAPAGQWPTDDQLSERIGLKVRFFEAGSRPNEALYAFEPTPAADYPHDAACELDPCNACLRARAGVVSVNAATEAAHAWAEFCGHGVIAKDET
jgi:hypothetical protein